MKTQKQLQPDIKITQNSFYHIQQANLILKIITIQRCYRGYSSRKQSKKHAKKLYDRKKIIQQLVITQQKYIHDLGIIVSDFQTPLLSQKIITESYAYIIFCNVEAIRRLNEQFFTIIYNLFRENYWPYKIIFEDVKKQVYFFKIYFEYLNNFTNSIGKINYLKENNIKFNTFLQRIKKDFHKYHNLGIQDYLIKPVQRLPKYVLLLKQLLKKTQLDHPDYMNILKVLQIIQQVNSSNNQKLNKVINNFKLSEIQKQVSTLPFNITQPGTQFILQQTVTIFFVNKIQDCIMYLLNDRIILTKKNKNIEKYLDSVGFKYGTKIMQTEQQQTYQQCFIVQSIDGDSVTLLFNTQEEKNYILQKIQGQIKQIEKKTLEKYSALQTHNQITESFLKRISRYDLNLEVFILGTQQRNDNMLKYTTYIIEIKIKSIRQKIFIRYSQLLQIQSQIKQIFPLISIKQSLYKTTWFFNHKPKTIEQRKISIQKFLQEILVKPEIIQNGGKILRRLGLPEDFYQLPMKFKNTETIVKRSVDFNFNGNSNNMVEGSQVNGQNRFTKKSQKYHQVATTQNCTKSRKTYRLSIFEDLSQSDDQKQRQRQRPFIKKYSSYNQKLKSSSNSNRKKLSINQLLQANQLNLGHFTRYSQNIESIQKRQTSIQIQLPWLQDSNGFIIKKISVYQSQRVCILLKKLSKQLCLSYYKDFRLFLQKQYSQQRILDDDQIILKIQSQIFKGKYKLVFKKMIFIDTQSQEQQLRKDMLRLKLIASQIVYEVKKGKYKLGYEKMLRLAVLIGVVRREIRMGKSSDGDRRRNKVSVCSENNNNNKYNNNKYNSNKYNNNKSNLIHTNNNNNKQIDLTQLALQTRQLLTNPFDSFFQKDSVWIKDYKHYFSLISQQLSKISYSNSSIIRLSMIYSQQQQNIYTNIIQLCYLGIVEQIKMNQLFGSMCYLVQISEEFREKLWEKIKENQEEDDNQVNFNKRKENNIKNGRRNNNRSKQQKNNRSKQQKNKQKDKQKQKQKQMIQNRNVWLLLKSNQIFLYTVSLKYKLFTLKYQQITKILCYPSSIIIHINNNSQFIDLNNNNHNANKISLKQSCQQQQNNSNKISFIKLKTTSSFSIRQLLSYYKNYNQISKKMMNDEEFTESMLEIIQENQKYTMIQQQGMDFIDQQV